MNLPYYHSQSSDFILYNGDCFELLPKMKWQYDMIFADPPYFLSNGGISVQSGKIVSVNKGAWDATIPRSDMMEYNWIG